MCDPKTANIWTARVIPVILLGIFGYASWAVTKHLCIDYLLNPPPNALVTRRVGPAIAILVIYYILLLAVLICYARLIFTIITNPGFLSYGPQWHAQNKSLPSSNPTRQKHTGFRHGNATQTEKPTQDDSSGASRNSYKAASDVELGNNDSPESEFWKKDVFTCNYDGRPAWCNVCMNFKPDRAHHCSEVNRCVRKMDHFCPWVGGIVSETSLKFFIQFITYVIPFTLHTLISMAYFVAEQKRKTGGLDVHKVLIVALAALFLLFSVGMSASTIQMVMENVSTIENLNKRTKIWYLAVLIPRPELGPPKGSQQKFMTITYPRPPEEQVLLQQHGGLVPSENNTAKDVIQPTNTPTKPQGTRAPSHFVVPRTFAILATKEGENPFDLGPLENLKQVMGYSYISWLVPIKGSPCSDHSSMISDIKMNEGVLERLRVEAELEGPAASSMGRKHRRRRHGGSRRSSRGL